MRILLADDQFQVRSALRLLLEQYPGLNVVGEEGETDGLLSRVQTHCPDLVLLDWELPGRSSTSELMPALRRLCPGLSVVALSGRAEAQRMALAAGVDAFVSKVDPPERLLRTINSFLHQPT